MSGESESPEMESDPIDADFEPVEADAKPVKADKSSARTRRGPGWIALGVTGVLAAVFGSGAGAMLSGGVTGAGSAPAEFGEEVQLIAESQKALDTRVMALAKDLNDAETRLKRQSEAAAAGRADGDTITDLTTQLNSIYAQLEALDVAAQEAGEGDGEALDQVLARLEALEQLDEDEVASPRVANRAVRVAQRRIDELEADLATRSEAMLDLVSRLEALEAAAENGSGVDGPEAQIDPALQETIGENTTAIGQLQARLDDLAAAQPVQGASAEDTERLTKWVQELRAKEALSQSALDERGSEQAAMFSVLTIEAAAREGHPFQTALAQLEEAMPGNRSVAKLKPLAATGAPTLARLQREFDAARAEAAKVETSSAEKSDGWGWMRQAFGEAIVVRRPGEEAADGEGANSFERIMAQAKDQVEARDLDAAIESLEQLSANLQAPFSDWLEAARARQTLDDGLDELRVALMDAGQ